MHRLVELEKLPCALQEFNQSVFCPVDVGKRAANARRRWKCIRWKSGGREGEGETAAEVQNDCDDRVEGLKKVYMRGCFSL